MPLVNSRSRCPKRTWATTWSCLHATAGKLACLVARASDVCRFVVFHEPDLNGELTAAAFGLGARRMLSNLSLAFGPRSGKHSKAPPERGEELVVRVQPSNVLDHPAHRNVELRPLEGVVPSGHLLRLFHRLITSRVSNFMR